MGKRIPHLLPITNRILSELGENVKLARLRRKTTATLLAQRAGITRVTLAKVEAGDPTVSLGIYAMVLTSLGLVQDLSLMAKDDILGRKLQDIELLGSSEDTSDKEIPKSLGKQNAATAFRRAMVCGAVPEWLSVGEMKKIEELYEEAATLTNKTGEKHHVDHIQALNGPSKGLHVLSNLQILKAVDNMRKSNKL